ncbi:serine hydrolase domain-containing protein [Symmachiella dynata]|uniref:serine hydrolase domain-containing protein n=1 Tax=Symmachiella dynata TaxID=2527995 RepID=UPI0030EE7E46
MFAIDTPQNIGLDPARWQHALGLVRSWTETDHVPAAGVMLLRNGKTTGPHLFGRQMCDADSPPIREDAIFLIASITKPIVGMAALLLVERGEFVLDDRVKNIVPEFGNNGKHGVTFRHLLTHTSGLPDMLPNNTELRTAQAPLSAFVEETCRQPLAFRPGRGVQYQSMGFCMLGEIIRRVTGQSCAEFLQNEIFAPLGMHDTALGAPDNWYAGENPTVDCIAELRIPEAQVGSNWHWNTRYWRQLGAPWGGLLTTPADLARFAQFLLNRGRGEDESLLSPATISAATRNQFLAMRDVPELERRSRPWGLGWRLHWPGDSRNFGDFLGPHNYGHWGATGSLLWIDPTWQTAAIMLTTQPQEPRGEYLARFSNAVVASLKAPLEN